MHFVNTLFTLSKANHVAQCNVHSQSQGLTQNNQAPNKNNQALITIKCTWYNNAKHSVSRLQHFNKSRQILIKLIIEIKFFLAIEKQCTIPTNWLISPAFMHVVKGKD